MKVFKSRYLKTIKKKCFFLNDLEKKALQKISKTWITQQVEWIGFIPVLNNGCLGNFSIVTQGLANQVVLQLPLFFSQVLALNPIGIFLFHNHPCGNLTPSEDDIFLTKRVNQLLDEFSIEFLGHWIVASTIQEWRTSSHSPSDIIAAKKLANYFGITLATLLTGEPDNLSCVNPDEFFSDYETVFDGYAKITIQRIRFKQIKKHHQE